MKASEFVTKLAELAPEKDLLLNVDYSEEEAQDYINEYHLTERETRLGLDTHDDELLELLNAWDLATLPAGPLEFHETPLVQNEYLELGKLELDKLIYDPHAKEYLFLSYEYEGSMLDQAAGSGFIEKAAKSGELLLDALFLISEYYTKTSTEQIDIDDESEGVKIRQKCAAVLGGEEYEVFCGMLTGY